ncbi:MAG: thiamine pyrophosphate-binding protein, partial [Actinomycetota bacterium]
ISLGPLSEGGFCIMQSDLVVLVGTKLDASVTGGGPPLFTGNEKLLQIDIDATMVGLNRTPDLAVQGDARAVLQQLLEAYDGKPKDAWLAQAKESAATMHGAWAAQVTGAGSPVPPGRVSEEVVKAAGPDAILVSDGGDIHTWSITIFPAYRPGSLLTTHDALGTIGVGVPYALGAKAAAPDRDVVMCIGDGSFGFGARELETAARCNLPFVAVVANNGEWGNIRHEQGKQFGETTGATALAQAGYEKIAEAFGGYGERVDDSEQLGAAIRRAIDSKKPAVVNVITQPGVVSPVTQMVGEMMAML